MAEINSLSAVSNGLVTNITTSTSDLDVNSLWVGGTSGGGATQLTKTVLNTLITTSSTAVTSLTGDVTGTGPGATAATIAAGAVTLAKMASLSANSIIGNNTGSSATPIALSQAQVTAMLNTFTTTLQGVVPGSGGGTTNFLRADGTWAAPAGSVTSVGLADSTNTFNITNSPVTSSGTLTLASFKSQAQNTILAAPSGSSGAPTFRTLVASDIPSLSATYLPLAGGTMSGSINMGSQSITSLAAPVNPNDAATKTYVDSAINGISWKTAALVATTANITLSGEQTIDGVLTSSSRVLVKNQSTASQNGLYTSSSGAWTRTSDMNTWSQVPAAAIFVQSGTVNADVGFVSTSASSGTIGTTAITFVQFSSAGAYTADNTTLQLVSGVFSVKNSGITSTQIATNTVANSNLAQMPTLTIKGNDTGGTANAADLTVAQVNAILPVFTSTLNGLAPLSGGGTTNFLRADGTWATPPSGFTNPMTTLGDIIYENATPAAARLPGNTSTTKQFLTQTGTGAASAAPAWGVLASADIPNNAANTTGTAANITATSNSTLTTLSALSLPGTQVTGNISGNAGNVTGIVAVANGGTGTSTAPTQYGVIYASSTTAFSSTAAGTLGYLLTSNATSAPTYQQINLGTSPAITGTLGKSNGGTGLTSNTTTPTATTFASWDANKNLSANNVISGFTTTATAAGTTSLSVTSTQIQVFTGTTTQTVTMPVTSTLVQGQQFTIINNSTGVVTVQSSGANTIQAMASNTQLTLTCILTSGTTAASWDWQYAPTQNSITSGTVTSVAMTVPSFLSVSGSPITSSGTLAVSLSGTALPITSGGTGQTTASAAFNALSPITSTGDLIVGNGTNSATRLGIGSTGQVLTVSGGTATWANAATPTSVTQSMVAGQSFSANTSYLVRMGIANDGGTYQNRVYAADNGSGSGNASTIQNFWVIGIASSGSAVSAGGSINVTMLGTFSLSSSDTGFSAGTNGQSVWLGTSGALTLTAPTTTGSASVKVGTVQTTGSGTASSLLINGIQLTGIN